MKAKPVKLIMGEGYVETSIEEATHVTLHFPGPAGKITLPVIIKGQRNGTPCWSWNGDVEKPTLRPSVRTTGHHPELGFVSHSWVNDGKVVFLDDCVNCEFKGQTVDLLDVE